MARQSNVPVSRCPFLPGGVLRSAAVDAGGPSRDSVVIAVKLMAPLGPMFVAEQPLSLMLVAIECSHVSTLMGWSY